MKQRPPGRRTRYISLIACSLFGNTVKSRAAIRASKDASACESARTLSSSKRQFAGPLPWLCFGRIRVAEPNNQLRARRSAEKRGYLAGIKSGATTPVRAVLFRARVQHLAKEHARCVSYRHGRGARERKHRARRTAQGCFTGRQILRPRARLRRLQRDIQADGGCRGQTGF